MLMKVFRKLFSVLIGDISDEQKEIAWEKFEELAGIIVEGAVKGAKG